MRIDNLRNRLSEIDHEIEQTLKDLIKISSTISSDYGINCVAVPVGNGQELYNEIIQIEEELYLIDMLGNKTDIYNLTYEQFFEVIENN